MQALKERRAVEQPSNRGAIIVGDMRPIWIPGPEDIVVDDQTGWAYVSSQARALGMVSTPPPQGAIYGLDLEEDRPHPINLTEPLFTADFLEQQREKEQPSPDELRTLGQPEAHHPQSLTRRNSAFHPLGMHFFKTSDGTKRLFVINERSKRGFTIEIFEVLENHLTHLHTIVGDGHLTFPDDLVAVGEKAFYVTNLQGFSTSIMQVVEFALHLRLGSVVYFDGERFTKVASGLSQPDGIAIAPTTIASEKRKFFVGSVAGEKLLVADWTENEPARELQFTQEITLPGAPDNLEWDIDGNLWVGVQDLNSLVALMSGLRSTAPSSVVCVSELEKLWVTDPGTTEADSNPKVDLIWKDDGAQISTSSVARVYKRADGRKTLLIGAAFDDRMLIGELAAKK